MAYDRSKVEFTNKEHDAAAAADEIYEALADGLQLGEDAPVIFGPAVKLFSYLAESKSKGEYASRLSDLAIMLKRDNWDAGAKKPN